MNKLLISILSIAVASALIGTGTYSYFSDPETSSGNTFTAGTLDLRLSNDGTNYYNDPTWDLISCVNMAPGDEVSAGFLYFLNYGTLDGKVKVNIDYTENDDPADEYSWYEYSVASAGSGMEVGSNAFAKHLWVTYASWDNVYPANIVYYWALQIVDEAYSGDWASAKAAYAVVDPDDNPESYDEFPTVFGLKQITLYFWDTYTAKNNEVFSPGEFHWETIKVKLDPNVGNVYQFDGIDVSIIATLYQKILP